MGVSRSVTLVVAYVITITNMNLVKAHDFVRLRRAFVNPNLGFREQLKKYYDKVKSLTSLDNLQTVYRAGKNSAKS
jgi:atypical dual specificity phosphatase